MSDGQGHFGHAHIAPASMYYAVFAALIVGTVLTVVAAKVDMGVLNNVVMLLIACTKATLVILFFMHVRWASRLTWVVAMAGTTTRSGGTNMLRILQVGRPPDRPPFAQRR